MKLPSTSPANAACSMDELLDAYAQVFEHTREFEPPTLDVPDVVALEQAIAAAGTPLSELMDRAGTALAGRIEAALKQRIPDAAAPENCNNPVGQSDDAASPLVVLLCGNGNNGGDGWVAAELLAQAGHRVCLVTKRAAEDITAQPAHDAAIKAAETLQKAGAILLDPSADELRAVMDEACVVVDAILGTGASGRSPKEPFASWIRAANEARNHAMTIAADAPSGVSAQDGQTVEPHIVADETVTMIVRKPGLVAPECGSIHVAPLAYIEPFLAGK